MFGIWGFKPADVQVFVEHQLADAFQFLLNKIVNRFPDDRKHIVVEAPSVEARIEERRSEQAANKRPTRRAEPPEDVDPEPPVVFVPPGLDRYPDLAPIPATAAGRPTRIRPPGRRANSR